MLEDAESLSLGVGDQQPSNSQLSINGAQQLMNNLNIKVKLKQK